MRGRSVGARPWLAVRFILCRSAGLIMASGSEGSSGSIRPVERLTEPLLTQQPIGVRVPLLARRETGGLRPKVLSPSPRLEPSESTAEQISSPTESRVTMVARRVRLLHALMAIVPKHRRNTRTNPQDSPYGTIRAYTRTLRTAKQLPLPLQLLDRYARAQGSDNA